MLTLISLFLFILSSAFLVWYFLKNDRGAKEPRSALFGAAAFGILAVFAALWTEYYVLGTDDPRSSILALLFVGLAVGAIEECAKFIPLALFIRKKSYFNEHTDGVIYFGIAGLTFGFIENLFYLFFYKSSIGGSELTGIFRLVVLFFFHAASTGIVGYYLAKAKIHKQSIIKPITALVTLALVHGFYDFLFLSASQTLQAGDEISESASALTVVALVSGLIISALLNTFLFLYYSRARQWDYSTGLAIDPKLSPAPVNNYQHPVPPIQAPYTQPPVPHL